MTDTTTERDNTKPNAINPRDGFVQHQNQSQFPNTREEFANAGQLYNIHGEPVDDEGNVIGVVPVRHDKRDVEEQRALTSGRNSETEFDENGEALD